jgi:HPt (histidine-containing phosphotransfer) domain-containing protein
VLGIVDKAALLERLDGDQALLAELVELFHAESPRLLEAVRAASAAGDAYQLTRAAHALKGSVANFCAPAAYEAAFQMESIGQGGDLAEAPAALAVLETALDQLHTELASLAPHAPSYVG